MLAHHGFGEELVVYAAAGAAGAIPIVLAVARARLAGLRRRLRRQ